MRGILAAWLALVVLVLAADAPRAQERADESGTCLVCGTETSASDPSVVHRGRTVHVHDGPCREHWEEDPAAWFSEMQPAGALFQESEDDLIPVRGPWFWLGVWMVAGMISSAAAAYLAVNRGQSPAVWFFAGLVGNVAALVVLVFVIPKADAALTPFGIPRGFTKVPTTGAPRPCPSCGAAIHPSASRCRSCGSDVEPLSRSEVSAKRGA